MSGELDWAREQSRFSTAFLAGETELAGREAWCHWWTISEPPSGPNLVGMLVFFGGLIGRGARGIEEGTFVELFVDPGDTAPAIQFRVPEGAFGRSHGAEGGVVYGELVAHGHLVLRVGDWVTWPTWPPELVTG